MQERVNRTINFPITDPSGISTQVPPVAQRAGMYLSFDANGVPQTVISAPNQPSPQTLSFGYIETTSTAGQTVFATPPYTPGANNLFVVSGGLTLTNTVELHRNSLRVHHADGTFAGRGYLHVPLDRCHRLYSGEQHAVRGGGAVCGVRDAERGPRGRVLPVRAGRAI